MNNVVLSTRNIDDLISDIADEVVKKLLMRESQAQKPDDSSIILTVAECAKFLDLAVPTIYSMISRGDLPGKRRNGRVYFIKSDIIDYIKGDKDKKVKKK